MKTISVNELPAWSPWPHRLMDPNSWEIPVRTIEKVEEEYDKTKYADCLRYYEDNQKRNLSPEAVKAFELNLDPEREICVSKDGNLYLTDSETGYSRVGELIWQEMGPSIERSATVVELGCGYGVNLWRLSKMIPDVSYIGGEHSQNAVKLADLLYRDVTNVKVHKFNFYDKEYDILENATPPITVFSTHAIEQLSSAAPVVKTLCKYSDKIADVFHFEPVRELRNSSLLDLMRKRYIEVNDYNGDLLSTVSTCRDVIHIVDQKTDVWGLNPLNPIDVLHWQFKN